jgi:hypothetical protein
MAFIACCGKRHRLLVCRPNPRFNNTTNALTCEPNLRTILDPSGLLRGQSLATTTKTYRQLDVFPNSHTRHNPRNNQHPDLSRWGRRGSPS